MDLVVVEEDGDLRVDMNATMAREMGIDPRRHPERVDATAAQILLQQYLDEAEQGPHE